MKKSIVSFLSENCAPLSFDRTKVIDFLNRDIEQQTSFFMSEEFGKEYHQNMSLPQAQPKDFLNQSISFSESKHLIAGIRFINLNREKPFLDVYPGFNLFCPRMFEPVCEKLKEAFKIFSPKRMRVRTNISYLRKIQHESARLKIEEDMIWLTGRAVPQSPSNPRMFTLMPRSPVEFYDEYTKEHSAFLEDHKNFEDYVPVSSMEELQESYKSGHLYAAYKEGVFGGFIGGRVSEFYGTKCIEIVEEFLFKRFRGQGLGKHLQAEFLQRLSTESALGESPMVFGSIHSGNVASLSTALANNRRPELWDVFVSLETR